uniref:Chondroitin sulfate proteoglycan 5 isoform X1 n=1 Tax=Pogona vitticeps TaxID=103695 RepID=A0ABM5GMB9_9SAUR
MGRPLAAPAAPGIPAAAAPAAAPAGRRLLLLLACLAALLAASEQRPRSPNTTDVQGALWKGGPEQTAPKRGPPEKDTPGSGKQGFFHARNGSAEEEKEEEAWLPGGPVAAAAAGGVKESRLMPRAVLPAGEGRGGGGGRRTDPAEAAGSPPGAGPSTPISVRYLSREAEEEEEEEKAPALCLGCSGGEMMAWQATQGGRREGRRAPLEALAEVTSFAQPLPDGARKLLEAKEAPGSLATVPESQEEVGSGDPQAGAPPGEDGGLAGGATGVPPPLPVAPEASSPPGLGHDAVATDLLLDPLRAEGQASPTEGTGPPQRPREPPDQDSAQKEEPLEIWVDASSRSPAEGTQGRTDLTWLEAGTPQSAVTPPVQAAQPPKPSSDPLASEIIDIDYYDLFDGEGLGEGAGSDGAKGKPSEDKGMSWSLHDLYDDFTPFDESDFYPTTSFYTDGDEEDLEEPEEEEEEEEDGGGGLARDLEDENTYRIPTPATPKIQTEEVQEAKPTSRHHLIPPLQTFVISGGIGVATPRPRPADAGRDLGLSGSSSENGTECRSGYIRHNTSCKSVCDTFPSYCHNGGQCYLVENLGAFCRCNTQDYIWHKGIRCESIITDFQVMCVAVGSAALVVLLLFMMTVFFAKKLYLLKTENNKLRKTKYRTPSELHNDNFSLSTIAEGSHPHVRKFCDTPCNLSPHARALAYYDNIICQDDPSAPHKLQDPLKSCLKEEESFNIQNSMSPKLENNKGDPDAADMNCLQNNLT